MCRVDRDNRLARRACLSEAKDVHRARRRKCSGEGKQQTRDPWTRTHASGIPVSTNDAAITGKPTASMRTVVPSRAWSSDRSVRNSTLSSCLTVSSSSVSSR